MKSIFFVCCFLVTIVSSIHSQSKTTLVKSMPTEAPSVVFDIPGEIKTSSWDKDYIRITITIEVTNNNEDVLKKLVSLGRYDFKSTLENGNQIISIPKLIHKISMKGVDLVEKLSLEVMLPYGTKTN
jgi:hypothetical protein